MSKTCGILIILPEAYSMFAIEVKETSGTVFTVAEYLDAIVKASAFPTSSIEFNPGRKESLGTTPACEQQDSVSSVPFNLQTKDSIAP